MLASVCGPGLAVAGKLAPACCARAGVQGGGGDLTRVRRAHVDRCELPHRLRLPTAGDDLTGAARHTAFAAGS
jgi:hypothetical protein